jgi:CheY-like chemotaxis protein
LRILHNPRYAGAFFFGRTRQRKHAEVGHAFERLPREEWTALIRDAHVGYITWDDFEHHQRQLLENAQAAGADRRRSPAREGPALLQGLVVCARCGERMTVRYHQNRGERWPTYVCQRAGIEHGVPICQSVPGHALDLAIGRILCDTITPVTIELTLAVQHELADPRRRGRPLTAATRRTRPLRRDLARRRYLRVDPDNRLVAAELEAQWNQALRAATDAQEAYERHARTDALPSDPAQHDRFRSLVADFPRLWQHPDTPDRERKRMVRLILDDVTLAKTPEGLTAHVRFRGGAVTTLTLTRALNAWQLRETSAEIVALVDQLLETHSDAAIATILNERGYLSGTRQPFHQGIVKHIRHSHRLRSRYARLRARGLLTRDEMADRLHVSTDTVKIWARHGVLRGHPFNDKHECLYEPPGPNTVKMQGRRLSDRADLLRDHADEVQYEA